MMTTLKTAMRILGYTNRDVERKLGLSSSYLSRLFGGMIELKFQHIVDIARAIGMDPQEMLYLAYPQPKQPPSEAAMRIRSLLGPQAAPQPTAAPPPQPAALPTEREMEEMMRRTMRKLFGEISERSRD